MKIQERYSASVAYQNANAIITEFQELSISILELLERCGQHRSKCKFEQMNAKKPDVWAELSSVVNATEAQLNALARDLGFQVSPDMEEVIEPEVIESK